MGKVVLFMTASVDGFMEGPGHDLSWHRVDEEIHEHFNHVLRDAGAFLEGRTTFEMMVDYWPAADQDETATPAMKDFAGIWREMPKILWSRTLESADWATEIRREVVPEEVEELKQRYGDLVLGGTDLAASFFAKGLVDELRLYVHPVVVGAGTPWLARDLRLDLRLIDSRVFGNGVVLLHYAVSGEGPRG